VERDGASFKMVDARIVNDGIMGIGLSWHPDGSLIMADWIGGYPLDGIGAVWKVDAKGGTINPLRLETQKILTTGFEKRSDDELVAQLSHRDQRVRQGAQLQLAKRGKKELLLGVARDANAMLLARVHAIWGYGQLLRRNAAALAPMVALLRDADAEIRTQAAKMIGDAAAAKPDAKVLIPLLGDESPRVRLQTAIALGKLREPAAVDALFAMAEKDGHVPVLRHGVVTGLTGCATAAQLAAKKSAASIDVRLASVVALRRQSAPAIAEFLRDKDPLVVAEAARGIHDDLSIPAAMPALAALADGTARDPVITRRAINANFRLANAEGAARLLAFALDGSVAREMREEALNALRIWKTPPPLDLVDGRARKITPSAIDSVLAPKLDALLALTDPGLKTLAIQIMITHALKARPEQIAAIVADGHAAGELRAEALSLLAGDAQNGPFLTRSLDIALAKESPAALHRAGVDLLLGLMAVWPAQGDRVVKDAETTLKTRSMPEKQHAVWALAKAATAGADAALESLGSALLAGTLEPALKLDVVEALRARSTVSAIYTSATNSRVAPERFTIEANAKLAAILKNYSDSAEAAAHRELLAGGSTERGRDIVANHLNANCMACHSLTAEGGSEVGPNLRSIGAQHDPAYFVEALLTPSAKIATGFGIVNVTLKDKTEVTGTLATETSAAVTVRLFDGTRKTIKREDIAKQTDPVSIMPPMGAILQPREIRDVVAYLSSLKGGGRNRAAKTEEEK
jgi:putative heme-binding domain-containing protein